MNVCPVCSTEQLLTPMGNIKKHPDERGGVVDPPWCKGAGKPPAVVKHNCVECGRQTTLLPDGTIGKHATMSGHRCEGPRTLTDEQDYVPSSYEEHESLVNGIPAALATEVAAEKKAIVAALLGGQERADAAVEAILNPERPTESLQDKSDRLLADQDAAYLAAEEGRERREGGPVPPSQEQFLGSADKKPRATPRKRQPLEPRASEYAVWFEELFFNYQNSRPRSQQATMGPSDAGAACMRRIAMKLTQQPTVNYEKDSWPAWMGTQGHSGAEKLIEYANEISHSQRYLIESALELGHPRVPRGHSDLFDRLRAAAIDWKFPGKSSLSKMHLDGCPEDYRVQLHIYGYGQVRAGETVREVVLIALPREGGTLKDMYVFVEDYDEQVAIDAMNRVEAIYNRLIQLGGDYTKAPKTPGFLCGYCPYYLPGDTSHGVTGCNGKKD